jgi:hypothetical protein
MLQGFREWEAASEDVRMRVLSKVKREIEDLETMEG